MRKVSLSIMAFLVSVLAFPAKAENSHYLSMKNLDPISGGTVYSICQDNDGALWFNTSSGIYRYNGHHLIKRHGQTRSNSMVFDGNRFVVTTYGNTILRFDTKSNLLKSVKCQVEQLNHSAFDADSLGVWISSGNTLYRMLYSTDTLQLAARFTCPVKRLIRLSSGDILLACDDNSVLIYGSHYINKVCLDNRSISALYEDDNSKVWVGYEEGGTSCIDIETGIVSFFDVPSQYVHSFCQTKSGDIYVGCSSGLFIVRRDGSVYTEREDYKWAKSVFSLKCDQEDNVWIGTYFMGAFVKTNNPFHSLDNKVWNNLQICSLSEDASGNIWVFTSDASAYRISPSGAVRKIHSFPTKQISSVFDARSNCIWTGAFNGGLSRIDCKTGKITAFDFDKVEGPTVSRSINAIRLTRNGVLLATSSGLYVFDPIKENRISSLYAGETKPVYSFWQDSDKHLYIAGPRLERINLSSGEITVIDKRMCRSLFETEDHSLWYCSPLIGLIQIRNGVIKEYPLEIVRKGAQISFATEIARDLLLIGASSGIVIYDVSTGETLDYTSENGLAVKSFREGCYLSRDDGTILLGGTNGLLSLNVDDIANRERSIGEPHIDSMTTPGDNDEHMLLSKDRIVLKQGHSTCFVNVTDFNYSGINENSCRYILEGYSKDWVDFDMSSSITFLDIPPGKYLLRVESVSNGNSDSIPVIVRPYWFLSPPAKLLYLVICLLLVYYILKLSIAKVRLGTEIKVKEEEHHSKIQHFIELSHKLRTPLALAMGQMELYFKNIGYSGPGVRIIEKSYGASKQMNDIIAEFLEIENKDSVKNEELITVAGRPGDASVLARKYHMMVVDENEQMQQLLESIFGSDFTVTKASDGQQALEMAKRDIPDIIISDTQLARLNGYDLCRSLRQNFETCHIPIILLTANASEVHTLQGLEMGADAYVSKPFNIQVLKARCVSLLENRLILKKKYELEGKYDGHPSDTDAYRRDRLFIDAAIGAVERNLYSPNLNVSYLCRELGISNSGLAVKIKELTGMTARQFIEDIKIKQAAQMLLDGGMRVSEIADKLNFCTPKYFALRFKSKYGKSPSRFVHPK